MEIQKIPYVIIQAISSEKGRAKGIALAKEILGVFPISGERGEQLMQSLSLIKGFCSLADIKEVYDGVIAGKHKQDLFRGVGFCAGALCVMRDTAGFLKEAGACDLGDWACSQVGKISSFGERCCRNEKVWLGLAIVDTVPKLWDSGNKVYKKYNNSKSLEDSKMRSALLSVTGNSVKGIFLVFALFGGKVGTTGGYVKLGLVGVGYVNYIVEEYTSAP